MSVKGSESPYRGREELILCTELHISDQCLVKTSMTIPSWPADLLQSGLQFFYPAVCLCCQAAEPVSAHDSFCAECKQHLSSKGMPRCQICSAQVGPHLDTSHGCVHCRGESFQFHSVTSLGDYANLLREMVLRVKYQHDQALATALVEQAIGEESDRLQSMRIDVVIPIPHHWSDRLLSRTDPLQLISARLGAFLKVPVARHILIKRRRTPKQQSMTSVTERRQNLRGAFAVPRGTDLTGLHVVLVDDVLTTGTTCHRASRELKKAGASRIDVFTIARNSGMPSPSKFTSTNKINSN